MTIITTYYQADSRASRCPFATAVANGQREALQVYISPTSMSPVNLINCQMECASPCYNQHKHSKLHDECIRLLTVPPQPSATTVTGAINKAGVSSVGELCRQHLAMMNLQWRNFRSPEFGTKSHKGSTLIFRVTQISLKDCVG